MQRADEMPDMITIPSMGARREREEQDEGKDERRGDGGGRVREHGGSESEEGGRGEEGWGEKERGRELFIPVGDYNDLILSLFCRRLAV